MSLLESTAGARTRIPSPGEMWRLFGDALEHRTDLARLEFGEARSHVTFSAALAAVAIFLSLFAGFAFTLFVAALVWDSPHRAAWLAGLVGTYLLGTIAAAWTLHRRLQTWKPLAETQSQLRQDQQCLSQLIKTALP